MNRKTAAELGLKRFSTGKVCRNGHLAERLVRNHQCCACVSMHNRKAKGKPRIRVKATHVSGLRGDAARSGLKTYSTGKPCKNGHSCERFVSNRQCVECGSVSTTKWKKANPEKESARNRARYLADPKKSYRLSTEWRKSNPDRSHANRKEWRKSNSGKVNSWNKKRKAAQMQRLPPWADLKAIESFYQGCPAGFAVDHILPLRGKLISGLHVVENLQYLPAIENSRKQNNFVPYEI